MATFNWPGFGITAVTPTLDQPAQVNRSAYTGVRAVASNPWHGKFSFKVTLATKQGDANFQAIRAFFTQLQGPINNFHLPAVEAPQNANTGVTVSAAAAQGATSLALTGLSTALVAGNMATINGQLLSLTSVGTLSGSAQTIDFKPALRAIAQAILSPPVNGALTQSAGGSLAATTCYVRTTWVTATGETLPSTETSLAVSANNVLNVAAPATPPANATGWNVYVSNATGTETKQNASPIGTTTAWVEPTSGLIAGSALPGANTTTASSVETAKPYALVALNTSSFSWDIGQWRRYGLSFEADEDVSGTDGASPSGDVWSATISGSGGISSPTDLVVALAASTGAGMVGVSGGGTVQGYINNPGGNGPIAASFPTPAFTNAAYYSGTKYVTNGAVPGSMYSVLQGGSNATDTLAAAIIVPSSATNHQTNAVAGYIQSNRAQPSNGGDVAGYFQAVSGASSSAVFALNAVMADTSGKTSQILSNELDFNVNAADTTVTGLNLVLVANTTLTGTRNCVRITKAFGTNGWSNGLVTTDGCIDSGGYAAFIGSQTSTAGTNREGQWLGLVSYNSSNTRYIAVINGDSGGGMQFQTGGGAFSFLNPARNAFWAYISSSGLTLPEIAAASVASPGSGYQTLFIDTADHKLKRKDSSGTVTIIA